MRRVAGLLACAGVLLAPPSRAEDAVAIWGSYYKERSTRVLQPTLTVTKQLGDETELELGYAVDQITSASAAVTPRDEVLSEARHDVRAAGRTRFGALRPGADVRASYEPDYSSITFGGELGVALDGERTLLRAYAHRQLDEVRQRERPGFEEHLAASLVGIGLTQVLRKDLVGGVALEAGWLRGYQENPYRAETHPRARDRYAVSAWARYRLEATGTTARLGYRLYLDDWDLVGHTVDLELAQSLGDDLVVAPRVRYHTQTGVYFTDLSSGFITRDPKLMAFDAPLWGVGLRWRLSILRGSVLDPFARSSVEPFYAYLAQTNAYGPAHLAQLGWYWPW